MLRVPGDLSRHRARGARDTSSSCTNFGCRGNCSWICHCDQTYLCQHWSGQNCCQCSANCRPESVAWIFGRWSNRLPIRGVVDYLEGCTTLPPVWIREPVRIPVRVPIAIELPNRLLIRRHRIHRQEHTQLRIHVPLLHVAQPGGRIAHMPGIPRSVRDLTTYHGAVGLVVIALDHVAVGIAFSHDRAQRVRVDVRDRRLGNCGWRHAKADQQHAAQPSA